MSLREAESASVYTEWRREEKREERKGTRGNQKWRGKKKDEKGGGRMKESKGSLRLFGYENYFDKHFADRQQYT